MRSLVTYRRRHTTSLIALTTLVLMAHEGTAQDAAGTQKSLAGCQTTRLGYRSRSIRESPQSSGESNVATIQEINHKIPKKARAEAITAEKARLAKKIDEAALHYRRAILIDPQFVAARNNLAFLFQESDPESAVSQLEEAVKIDPHSALLFRNLTIAYARSNRYEEAERAARTTVDLDRTGALAPLMLLGFALVDRQKLTDEALQCFERARDEYPVADLLAARVLMGQGKLARARAELRTYLCGPEPKHSGVAKNWLELIDRHEEKKAALLLP